MKPPATSHSFRSDISHLPRGSSRSDNDARHKIKTYCKSSEDPESTRNGFWNGMLRYFNFVREEPPTINVNKADAYQEASAADLDFIQDNFRNIDLRTVDVIPTKDEITRTKKELSDQYNTLTLYPRVFNPNSPNPLKAEFGEKDRFKPLSTLEFKAIKESLLVIIFEAQTLK